MSAQILHTAPLTKVNRVEQVDYLARWAVWYRSRLVTVDDITFLFPILAQLVFYN